MKHLSSQLLLGLTMIVATTFGLYPKSVFAYGQYFGGMKTATFTCSCSGNTLIYISNYAGKGGSLALVYDGSAKLYNNHNIYGTYLMGSYSPGGQCTYYVGEDCVEMQSDGRFDSNPGTGTS